MKRGGSKAGRGSKVAKAGQSRRLAPRSRRFESATDAGVKKQNGPSKKLRPVVAGSDADAVERTQRRSVRQRKVTTLPVPQFDAIRVADLIEACRARVATLTELAGVITRTLFELYEYERDDPELWQCCSLIRHVLKQVHAALIPLGISLNDTALFGRAAEIASGCELQRQWLRPTVHVVRATVHVLIDVKLGEDDEILPALRDLENGLAGVVNDLERVIQCCPCQAGKRRVGR